MSTTEPIVLQRIRNRIIDYLEWTSSFEEQARYQRAAPFVHVPNEVINQWEDWVDPDWRGYLTPPLFSPAEIEALGRFYGVWDEVKTRTPDPLPPLTLLFETPAWRYLAAAAADTLVVFQDRGRFSEEAPGPI